MMAIINISKGSKYFTGMSIPIKESGTGHYAILPPYYGRDENLMLKNLIKKQASHFLHKSLAT